MNIWGRDFNLEIMFGNDDESNSKPVQREAWQAFLNCPQLIEESKVRVIDYCLKHYASEFSTSKIDNIFKYVIPESIYIKNTRDNSHVVALVCAYKFDEDNGLAVIFKNETFDKVGTQNII